MSLPKPAVGLVINYGYLWLHEQKSGQTESRKSRPAAVIVVVERQNGPFVMVLGITHTPPQPPADAIEIPASAKRRLGLDDQRSWIIFSEANAFTWPGDDLRPRDPRIPASIAYGYLPADIVRQLRLRFHALVVQRSIRFVKRD